MSSVFAPYRIAHLLSADARNVWRDPILGLAIVMSLALAPGVAAFRGPIDAVLLAQFGLADATRLLVPLVLVLPAMLVAWVVGFLLLDDRDDGALLAIAVTPIGRRGFFAWRSSVAALVAALFALYGMALLTPTLSPLLILAIALMAGAEAVAAAIVLPALARNKVEGLALTKLTNFAAIVPFAALIPDHWRFLAAPVPSYWIGELLLVAPGNALPLAASLPLAALVHAAAVMLVFRLARP